MTIDKKALFESTKALWPADIVLSAPDATNEVYWANEKAFPADDNWRQLAMWSYHQALSQIEDKALLEGISSIRPHELGFAAFDSWMRSNLDGDDCWLAERDEWEGAT